MTSYIDLHRITRHNVLKVIEDLSLEQINKIPDGFTGNIAWHIGHLVATQQGLIYRLSGLTQQLDPAFIDKYKKGSVPTAPISEEEYAYIKKMLITQVDELQKDIDTGVFKTYTHYTTSYGNTIHSFNEALVFINVHEALHIGYIMSLRRVVLGS